MSEWISVNDVLPEVAGEYICEVMNDRDCEDMWLTVAEFTPTRKKAFGFGWDVPSFETVVRWAHPPTEPRTAIGNSKGD